MKAIAASNLPKVFSVFVAPLLFSAGCGAEPIERPSLHDRLISLEPAIFCVESANSDEDLQLCHKQGGIGSWRASSEAKTQSDFADRIFTAWIAGSRMYPSGLTPALYSQAVEYARCIENAAYSYPDIDSKTEAAREGAVEFGEQQCADHPFSRTSMMQKYPNLASGEIARSADIKAWALARIFANSSVQYLLEANGWVSDAMRPCFRYGDGRPPSPGCAGKPQPRLSAPPSLK